jgi:lysophospholipase L1-like esterase
LNGLHPKAVVLLIGTNNTSEKHPDWTAEQTGQAIEKVVSEVRARLPEAKVIVMGILPAGKGEEKERLDDRINADLASRYLSATNVQFLDVSGVFRVGGQTRTCLFADPRSKPPEGAVHPTPLGQAKLAAVLEPMLAKDLGVAPKAPMRLSDPLCP